MQENVFLKDCKKLGLEDYMRYGEGGRGNLGEDLPVLVYRLLEYSLREELSEEFGKEKQTEIFRRAGFRAGTYFACHLLDLALPFNEFVAQLQSRLEEQRIGVLRLEKLDLTVGHITLTVSEDADCSGLPLLGETVCNYDEGFIAGILSSYTGNHCSAKEVDCWATGDRVCRFEVKIGE